jgi:hypothetical protein
MIPTTVILAEIEHELWDAEAAHASMNSAHEAFAVILEELDEFWEEVRKKRSERLNTKMRDELVQTAAMCVRAIRDLNMYRQGEC